jgi:hypothetical protein
MNTGHALVEDLHPIDESEQSKFSVIENFRNKLGTKGVKPPTNLQVERWL